jgi:hypothetical protein
MTLLALPAIALVAGLLALGGDAPDPAAAASRSAGADGCAEHALKYVVTDDAAELNRQKAFEATGTAITEPGFYGDGAAPASTATLHAASHGSVVVYYRSGLSADRLRPLRALVAKATAAKVPLIVAPRRQAAALTTIALGRQLDCSAADAAQTTRVQAFATAVYPSLKP